MYRPAHVGNLRSYLLADLIRRIAERHRLLVTSCQNITDVGHLADDSEIDPGGEDKILAQARAEGKTALDVARHYEKVFHADCAALNIRPADSFPRASECIGMMIDLIARLIDMGHAYPVPGGSVYFDARSFPSYGELSGNRLADLRPGHRSGARAGQQSVDPDKRFHADWALWKAAPADRELTYAAPWGTGFPGWHTECSAMSLHYLGETIDIHTGGIDLRFPHHEDERAQSNSVTGHEVVQHWVHGEHLLFEGRKMAKSTGNVVLLADLTGPRPGPARAPARVPGPPLPAAAEPDLGGAAGRGPDPAAVAGAGGRVGHARRARPMCAEYVSDFDAAFDDDLDTPAALRVLRTLEKDGEIPPGAKFETFAHADHLLGPGPGAGHRTGARAAAAPGPRGGTAGGAGRRPRRGRLGRGGPAPRRSSARSASR